jgi:hypothetical protein
MEYELLYGKGLAVLMSIVQSRHRAMSKLHNPEHVCTTHLQLSK